jgi:hypothetical protein
MNKKIRNIKMWGKKREVLRGEGGGNKEKNEGKKKAEEKR